MKIFITGATGFIGGHLLTKLQSLGHEVVTDMRYFESEKWSAIIHLAATTHIREDFDHKIFESNIVLSKKIMSTPYRTIFASSCSAAHLTNPYAYTKRYCEWLGEKHGNAVGLRFFNCYGPNNNKGIVKFLCDQPDGAKITIRGENLIRDYIHVNSVVDEICQHLEKKNNIVFSDEISGTTIYEEMKSEVIDVGTGVGTSTIDLVSLFTKLSGKKFYIETIPAGDNEPQSMISNNEIPNAIDLETGLLKMINND